MQKRERETATPTKSDRVAITDGTVDLRRGEGEWQRFGSEVERNMVGLGAEVSAAPPPSIDQGLIRKEAKHLLRQPPPTAGGTCPAGPVARRKGVNGRGNVCHVEMEWKY